MRTTRLLTAAALLTAATFGIEAPAGASIAGGHGGPGGLAGPPPPVVTIDDAYGYEADGGVTFTVELDRTTPDGVYVPLGLDHGETDADDIDSIPAGVSIPAGETSAEVVYPFHDDGVDEEIERFTLHIPESQHYERARESVDGYVLDGGGPQLRVIDAAAPEGDGPGNAITVTVQASYAPNEDVTFRVHTGVFGFEADEHIDFEPIDEIVTLPAGETSVETIVPIVGDDEVEDDELVPVHAEDPSLGEFAAGNGSAILRILDDDTAGDDGTATSPTLPTPGPGHRYVPRGDHDDASDATATSAVPATLRDGDRLSRRPTPAPGPFVAAANTDARTPSEPASEPGLPPLAVALGLLSLLMLGLAARSAWRAVRDEW